VVQSSSFLNGIISVLNEINNATASSFLSFFLTVILRKSSLKTFGSVVVYPRPAKR